MQIPDNIGNILSEARERSSMAQNELAARMAVDPSRLSRIETGAIIPTISEVKAYLAALDTDHSRHVREFLKQDWRILARPGPWHPQREALWKAENSLQNLAEFESSERFRNVLRPQLEFLRGGITKVASYLEKLDHNAAFIGDIGVGKTTALSLGTGLVIPRTKGAAFENVALATGGGRTTLCEVIVRSGPAVAIIVEPLSDREIYDLVDDLCAGLLETRVEGVADESQKGVSKELDRALRNMAGLARRRTKAPDGKRTTIDPARSLVQPDTTPEDLRAEFAQRLTLWDRTERELWYKPTSERNALEWISDTFEQINLGRHPSVSLPRRITVVVTKNLLADGLDQVSIIDSKGIDETAIRPDLKVRLDDPRTVNVVCTSFMDAPGATAIRLVEHIQDTGSDAIDSGRLMFLVLPRPAEARQVKDDIGEMPESDQEGYEIKADHIEQALRRFDAQAVPVHFFNAASDNPEIVSEAIVERIHHIREYQAQRIESLAGTARHLIENAEQAQVRETQKAVGDKLARYVERHERLPDRLRQLHDRLITEFRERNARSIWASTRRGGDWPNFPVYFFLGTGAQSEVHQRTRQAVEGLKELLDDIIGDPDMEAAAQFVSEIRKNIASWHRDFLKTVHHIGEEAFKKALADDSDFWTRCERRYGGGHGYRDDLAENAQNWFEDSARNRTRRTAETKIARAWHDLYLGPLRRLYEGALKGEETVDVNGEAA